MSKCAHPNISGCWCLNCCIDCPDGDRCMTPCEMYYDRITGKIKKDCEWKKDDKGEGKE